MNQIELHKHLADFGLLLLQNRFNKVKKYNFQNITIDDLNDENIFYVDHADICNYLDGLSKVDEQKEAEINLLRNQNVNKYIKDYECSNCKATVDPINYYCGYCGSKFKWQ